MTKYFTYEGYQATPHSHIGVAPSHWQLKRTKYLFDRQCRPPRECDETVTAFRDGQVTLRANRRTDGFTESIKEIGYQGVRCGDLVVHAMDGFAGAIGVSDSDGKCTPVYNVCKPISGSVSSKYYGLYLRNLALNGYVESLAKGIRERSTEFRYAELKEVWLPEPPIDEQEQIANFLDYETAKIDTLIDKQQQLIKLLKEKRQAVISHAVTKGLNPAAPMKNSGVEWLGEVPEHWCFAPLRRYLVEHKQGYYTTADYVDDGVKLLRITDLRDLGDIDISDCPQVPDNDSSLMNYELIDGDVVFARTGGAGSFGVVKDLKERVVFASYLIRFRFQAKFYEHDYLKYMLLADSFQKAVKQNIHGGVNQNIHAEDIKNTYLTQPSLGEQKEIITYLEEKILKMNLLIEKAQKTTELLRERRTALISAAVTGKIDVRNWQPVQSAIQMEASA